MHATCWARPLCNMLCSMHDMLCSNVAIVWPVLANAGPTMLRYVVLKLAGVLPIASREFTQSRRIRPRMKRRLKIQFMR